MQPIRAIWKYPKAILALLYAIFLLYLIPTFFMNYHSRGWMESIARRLQIKEMDFGKNNAQQKQQGASCHE